MSNAVAPTLTNARVYIGSCNINRTSAHAWRLLSRDNRAAILTAWSAEGRYVSYKGEPVGALCDFGAALVLLFAAERFPAFVSSIIEACAAADAAV